MSEQTQSVAILGDNMETAPEVGDADLDGRRRRRSGRRGKSHCTTVKRGKGGYCACAKRSAGKGKAGAFASKCSAKGLKVRRPKGLRGFAGLDGLSEQADREFAMDGLSGATSVPKQCTKWATVKSPSFGRPVKVCAAFDGMDDLDDAPLAGPLAKWHGFGVVGGGPTGPLAGVVAGGLLAGILGRFGDKIPGLNKVPGGPLVAAALLAAAALAHPKSRPAGVGALAAVLTVGAYKMVKGEPLAGFGAIVPEVEGYEGLAAIVPEVEGLGAGPVDVLSGLYGDDEDDEDEDMDGMGGMGADIDVLSGAFGSLPFAGAH